MTIALANADWIKWTYDKPLPFFHTAGNIHYLMEFIRLFLFMCSCSALLFLFIFWCSNSPRLKVVAIVVMSIGLGNVICWETFKSNQFSALYERNKYEIEYEAELIYDFESDYRPIFCILTIEHSKGCELILEEGFIYFYDLYFITDIELPYGRSYEYEDIDFYPGEHNDVSLGVCGAMADIRLGSPASEKSYARLSNEILSCNGEVVASINGNVYHNENWCPHVKNIKRDNLVRFNSTWEAEILGYDICPDCNRW